MTESQRTGIMDIAVYGGSFNPPHLGHREAVLTALERLDPDQPCVPQSGWNCGGFERNRGLSCRAVSRPPGEDFRDLQLL